MEGIIGFAFLAIVIGGFFLKRRLSKATNRGFWNKKAYKEQQELLGKKWRFKTSASIADVKYQLGNFLGRETKPGKIIGGYYVNSEGDNFINYSCGSALMLAFDATIIFMQRDNNILEAELTIPRWNEADGVCDELEAIRMCINLVMKSFMTADENCEITELSLIQSN
jgi:hypothetical protein